MAAAIKAGFYTIGIGAGVETMSQNPMAWEGGVNPRVAESQNAQNCLVPMGKSHAARCSLQPNPLLRGVLSLARVTPLLLQTLSHKAHMRPFKGPFVGVQSDVLQTAVLLVTLGFRRRDVRERCGQVQHFAGGAGQVRGAVARARGGGAVLRALRRPDRAGAHGLEGPENRRGEARHHLGGVLVSIVVDAHACEGLIAAEPRFGNASQSASATDCGA